MSKLPDVRGRITYISSHAKQENLYAVYEMTDRRYWTELAKCNQQDFQKSGTEGKCIEAREFIIALPVSFPNLYEPDSGVPETEIQQIKKKYITDRIRESVDIFGRKPERLGSIIMTAVMALALLISKVLDKARELQSRIDRKNEEIDLLKIGLSGIVKRYGFQTVHDFYKVFATSKTANADYQAKADKWEEKYRENTQRWKESIYKRLRNYQRENSNQYMKQTIKSREAR